MSNQFDAVFKNTSLMFFDPKLKKKKILVSENNKFLKRVQQILTLLI